MKILVIGKGAREHAICWKAGLSPLVETVYVAPGNDGIAQSNDAICIDISEMDNEALLDFAQKEAITLTIVGPEDCLMNGIVDVFEQAGQLIWGPKKVAAQIEGSKSFAKELMARYHVNTAEYETFTDVAKAKAYLAQKSLPIVIKADGLAAGKGVVVATTAEIAISAVEDMLIDNKFGAAGSSVVIEEFLAGEEFSFMSFVHAGKVYPMIITQDHKRAFDGDKGPNTGGMGAYGPVFPIKSAEEKVALKDIMEPIVQGMHHDGLSFTGFLYGGLIKTTTGFKVIEFNARFGDPETEIILPLLKSDLVVHLLEFLQTGEMKTPIEWEDAYAIGVVLAGNGYPDAPIKNQPITLSNPIDINDSKIFYAAVKQVDDMLVTNGGRILICVTTAKTFEGAYQKVYNEMEKIEASGTFYRKDIGYKQLERA